MKKILFILFVLLNCTFVYSQTGVISGKVLDGQLNDTLPFASVIVKGTNNGSETDFEGNYSIDIEPGTYTLIFSFVGYNNIEITNVVVNEGKETIVNTTLKPSSTSLDAVVVSATSRKNTEKAILNIQKKSATVVDGMSIQSIKKSGASNVATAIRQVPGVSIQGGKFVVVRGLSDRYTKTTLNGLDVPGLDPDRNSLQVDIFPTNILDNLIVSKTASSELPADFTGGVVDIALKDFSNKPEYTVFGSFGFNPSQHFQDNFQKQTGGSTDFLGFDDGSRDLPILRSQQIPVPVDDQSTNDLRTLTQAFDSELRAPIDKNLGNFNIGFTASNSFQIGSNKLGYQANASYRNTTRFFENAFDGVYQKETSNADVIELVGTTVGQGPLSEQETLLTGLAGLSFKTFKSKYKLTGLFIKNGLSQSTFQNQTIGEIGGSEQFRQVDGLTFTEKSITNLLVHGSHLINGFKIDWKFSPTFSVVDDKDHRITPLETITTRTENLVIPNNAIGSPIRIFRNLEETNYTGKIDIDKSYMVKEERAKVRFGGLATFKKRIFSVDDYTFSATGNVEDGNPNTLFTDENVVNNNSGGNQFGLVSGQQFSPNDSFDANQNTIAVYASNELRLFKKLRTIIGLRLESFESLYTGFGQVDGIQQTFDNSELINVVDLFPSVNLVYEVNDNLNTRFSYSRTTARPSFREGSASNIFDAVTNRRFLGALAFGITLRPTYINNFDFRIEYFGENNDVYSISSFYKDFTDVIELAIQSGDPNEISPRNFDSANLIGVEVELKKSLDFINLKKFYARFNASVVESVVDVVGAERESRERTKRTGETVDSTRPLLGQAPFIINTAIEYNNSDIITASLNYNVQGETLEIVGVGAGPDVFSQPFHNLVFNASKNFGNHKVTFKATNLLNDERESFYRNFLTSEIFSNRVIDRTFTLGYTYKF